MGKDKLIISSGSFEKSEQLYISSESLIRSRNLLSTLREYRQFVQPEQIEWKNYTQDFFHVLNINLDSIFSNIYLASKTGSKNSNFAILAIIPPEESYQEIYPGITWQKFLFYIANSHNVRYGIVTNGLELKIFDFNKEDFVDSFFNIKIDRVIQDKFEDSFQEFINILDRIKGNYVESKVMLTGKHRKRALKDSRRKSTSYDLAYHLIRSDKLTKQLFENLQDKIFSLSKAIDVRYNKMYIAYILNSNFCEIHFQRRQLKIWVNACIEDLTDPLKLCRDMRGIGHYGTGESELFLTKFEELEDVFEIIKQSYKLNKERYGEVNYFQNKENINSKPNKVFDQNSRFFWDFDGETHFENSARRVMVAIVTHLAETIPDFLIKFEEIAKGRTRNYIARDKMNLYPNNPELCNNPTMSTEFLPGWWIALNLNKKNIEAIIMKAVYVAGINMGEDIDFYLGN